MTPAVPQSALAGGKRLLVDTNLLVLLVVGTVNPNRIQSFKRTSQYNKSDFHLLTQVIARFDTLYTVAHVMAEVSNLTDLAGRERLEARQVLKKLLEITSEPAVESLRAAEAKAYHRLGLVDAAISLVAHDQRCSVLTDDLDLYLSLAHEGINALNFAHLQAQEWRV